MFPRPLDLSIYFHCCLLCPSLGHTSSHPPPDCCNGLPIGLPASSLPPACFTVQPGGYHKNTNLLTSPLSCHLSMVSQVLRQKIQAHSPPAFCRSLLSGSPHSHSSPVMPAFFPFLISGRCQASSCLTTLSPVLPSAWRAPPCRLPFLPNYSYTFFRSQGRCHFLRKPSLMLYICIW